MVRKIVKDKTPSTYSFSIGFFQSCWDAVNKDLMKVFQEFFSVENFEKSFNVTFIAFIPKKIGTSKVKDYQSISLVNGVYKIISKMLANHLGEDHYKTQKMHL